MLTIVYSIYFLSTTHIFTSTTNNKIREENSNVICVLIGLLYDLKNYVKIFGIPSSSKKQISPTIQKCKGMKYKI